MATKTKIKPDPTLFRCWQSFAGNDALHVSEGTRLRADHELVRRYPDHFVRDDTPDDEIARLKAEAAAPSLLPDPPPLGRVRLRVLPGQSGKSALEGGRPLEVHRGGRTYYSGETLEAEGVNAQHLLDAGVCELVKHLPKKEAA